MVLRITTEIVESGGNNQDGFYDGANIKIFNTLKKPATTTVYVPQDPPTTGQLWPRGNW